jgi:hypothetical protein
VQKQFKRGVALLHSFAYSAAEKAFRDAAETDPNCAMAHWGVAMTYVHQLNSRALVSIGDLGGGVLPPGTGFTVISNTAATQIAGAFSNLADGSTLTVRSNTYQVSYEGGDGNDLTLTVQ